MTTYMDPLLFKAAEAGDIGPFEKNQTCLDQLLTPDENTILHVYLGNQSREPESTYFVDKIHCYSKPIRKVKSHSIWQQDMVIPMW